MPEPNGANGAGHGAQKVKQRRRLPGGGARIWAKGIPKQTSLFLLLEAKIAR